MAQGVMIFIGAILLFIALRGKGDVLLGVLFNPTHAPVPLGGAGSSNPPPDITAPPQNPDNGGGGSFP